MRVKVGLLLLCVATALLSWLPFAPTTMAATTSGWQYIYGAGTAGSGSGPFGITNSKNCKGTTKDTCDPFGDFYVYISSSGYDFSQTSGSTITTLHVDGSNPGTANGTAGDLSGKTITGIQSINLFQQRFPNAGQLPPGPEDPSTQHININVDFAFPRSISKNTQVGPVTVQLLAKTGGSSLNSIQTDSLPADGTANHFNLNAVLTGVAPGDYQVCVPQMKPPAGASSPYCQPAQKSKGAIPTLTFSGDAADGSVFTTTDPSVTGNGTGQDCATGGSFTWLVCPIVTTISTIIVGKDGKGGIYGTFIEPELAITPIAPGNSPELYQIWGNFRNFADALFLLIFIYILFGSMLSIGADAYTVKKALPRLVAAVILVQISFFLCGLAVDIGNVLGAGIGQLAAGTVLNNTGNSGSGIQQIAAGLFGGVIFAGAGALVTYLALWPLILPVAVGLIISVTAFLITLVVRHILINTLIVISPLAFIAWILPNTENLFKKWLSNLMKAILMFPLIAILLVMARVTAAVSGTSGGVSAFLGLFAPIVAFFMIPATFKASGTLMGKVSGAIQDRGHKYSSGVRQSKWAKNLKDDQRAKLPGKEALGGFKGYIAGAAQGRIFGSRSATDQFRKARAQNMAVSEMQQKLQGANISDDEFVNFAKGLTTGNTLLDSLKGDAAAVAAAHRIVNEKGLYEPKMLKSLQDNGHLNNNQKQMVWDAVKQGNGATKMAETNIPLASLNWDELKIDKDTGEITGLAAGADLGETITDATTGKVNYKEGSRGFVIQSRLATLTAQKAAQQKGHGWKLAQVISENGPVNVLGDVSASVIEAQADPRIQVMSNDSNRKALAGAILGNKAGVGIDQGRAIIASIDPDSGRVIVP